MRRDQRRGHGEQIVQVGPRGLRKLRPRIEHALGGGLDGGALLVGGRLGPGEVVVDDVLGVPVVAFESTAGVADLGHVHLRLNDAEVKKRCAR